jgi:fumarate reductase subunit D
MGFFYFYIQMNSLKYINIFLSSLVVLVCIIMAYGLFFTTIYTEKLNGFNRSMFGALAILYAVFRITTIYSTIKKMQREKNEN